MAVLKPTRKVQRSHATVHLLPKKEPSRPSELRNKNEMLLTNKEPSTKGGWLAWNAHSMGGRNKRQAARVPKRVRLVCASSSGNVHLGETDGASCYQYRSGRQGQHSTLYLRAPCGCRTSHAINPTQAAPEAAKRDSVPRWNRAIRANPLLVLGGHRRASSGPGSLPCWSSTDPGSCHSERLPSQPSSKPRSTSDGS